jgi:hypothetical protein
VRIVEPMQRRIGGRGGSGRVAGRERELGADALDVGERPRIERRRRAVEAREQRAGLGEAAEIEQERRARDDEL